MGLTEWGDKKVEALSKGMAQKVQIIGTLLESEGNYLFDSMRFGLG